MIGKPAYERITRAPKTSFFLFGPRGVGKSTWARRTFGPSHRIDLLDEKRYQSYLADPSLFAGELRTLDLGSRVVVDEVQRIPSLLNEVHRFLEERHLRFVLLGSSARKLKTDGTNLLAGRALWKTMYPLVPEELGDDFALEKALQFGSIPLVWTAEDKASTLTAYVRLYVKEEIKAEALVRNLPGFVRFLPIAGLFHGQLVNVSAIARDSGVSRTTVSGYLEILEDTLLVYRLRPHEARLRVRERKHPKLYWVDPGLVRGIKGQLGPVTHEETGALMEGWILTLLRAYAEDRSLCSDVTYWSPTETRQMEVDFLIRRENLYLAIEVKSQQRFSNSMLRGLKAIADLDGLVRRILIYRGERRLRSAEGIDILPVEDFLVALADDKLWP